MDVRSVSTNPELTHLLWAPMVLALAAVGLCSPDESLAQGQTWAVVVGIDDYLHFGDVEGGDLRGAEADAIAMGEVLSDVWEVPEQNVLTLLGADATRAAIETAITGWLPERISAADEVFFYFAGNGSKTADRDGDESDGLDETICPVDVVAVSTEFDILDDELNTWLSALATDRVVVILDSGHSGETSQRGIGYSRNRSLARYVPRARSGADGPDTVVDDWAVEIAAAASDQLAVDFATTRENSAPSYGGAFTTHLVDQIRRAAPGTTLEDVYRMTFRAVKADQFRQEPTLSGPAHAFALPGGDASAGVIRVASVEAGVVKLRGAVSGSLRVGSVLRAASGSMFRVESAVPGRIAEATILSGTPTPGEEAAVVGLPPLSDVLRVSVDLGGHVWTADAESLVQGTIGAVLVPADGSPHIAVRLENNRFVLVGRDGAVRPRGDLGPNPDALTWRSALQRESNFQRLGTLENPANPFRVVVGLVGHSEVEAGDYLQFRVRSQRTGFLTLVDLSTDGTASVIFPNEHYAKGTIQAGEDLLIPQDDSFRLTAEFPTGLGMVRAFVTTEPIGVADFAQSTATRDIVSEISDGLNAVASAEAGSASDSLLDPSSWSSGFAFYTVR